MSRKTLILSLATVAVLSLSALAVAGPGFGPGFGPGGCGMDPMQALTPEQREQAMTLFEEHQKAMIPLREQIRARHALLEAALRAEKPDTKAVDALTKELGELKVRALTEQVALRKKLAAAGLPAFGPGMGGMSMGMGGPGKGHGRGMGRGMGPGMNPGMNQGMNPGMNQGMNQSADPGMMGMDMMDQEPGPDMMGMMDMGFGMDADMDEDFGYGG